jgi:hypothetical protein
MSPPKCNGQRKIPEIHAEGRISLPDDGGCKGEEKAAYGDTQKQHKSRKHRKHWADRLPAGWSLLIKVFKVNRFLFSVRGPDALPGIPQIP